jgi:hypothetical protein
MDTSHLFTSAGMPADIPSLHGEQVAQAQVDDVPVGVAIPAFVEPFNAEVRALAPEERGPAVAASLESVRP